MTDAIWEDIVGIQKVDTSEPGLYVVKINTLASAEQHKNTAEQLRKALDSFTGGGNGILILDANFDVLYTPTDYQMKDLGWIRKV